MYKNLGAGLPKAWTKQKRFTISGADTAQQNYLLKLNVHRGFQQGDLVGTDIFLDNGCKTDFSDLRFTDANGNSLQHYVQSSGNYEIIYDDAKIGMFCGVYNGTLYASQIVGDMNNINKSLDNGQTWKKILTGLQADTAFCWIDPWGNIYVGNSYYLKRSSDQGNTWASVLDMTSVQGTAVPITMGCDSLGNLYFGRYQGAYDCAVYKSTDQGQTWTRVYTNTNVQHVHGLYIDPYTDYIYVGCDASGTTPIMIRSTDHGSTWTTIWTAPAAQCTNILAFPGIRIMGGGDKGPANGFSLWKTTDDVTFTPLISSCDSMQGMTQLGNYIYICTVGHNANIHSRILRIPVPVDSAYSNFSVQNIWYGPVDTSIYFPGYECMTVAPVLPNGATESHLLAGKYQPASVPYKSARIFNGGNHYQATVLVKLPSLPTSGMDIIAWTGNPSASSISTINILPSLGIAQATPLLRLPMNEGSGTTVNDTSGNGYNGTVHHASGKGGWNAFSGRFIGGPNNPLVKLPGGASYNFVKGDYIEIPTNATFEALKTSFSIVAWIRTPMNQSVDGVIIGKGTGSNGWTLIQHLDQIRFCVGDGSTSSVKGMQGGAYNGDWHMVGMVLENASPLKGFHIFDGLLCPEVTFTNDIAGAGLNLRIGLDTAGANGFTGDICDVQIYPYQLTQTQIWQLWENSMAITKPAVVTTLT